ncbi:MAG: hypothetical protein C5B49_02290 [Bdellovibrio sp.]|nr:MAG: hypothetical protein C5B49_02290 [Bdellovibrio sp.]
MDPNVAITSAVYPIPCTMTGTCGTGINYIALSPYAQQALTAYNNQLVNYAYDTSGYFRQSTMSTSNYIPVLRDAMGVCDREYYNGGTASCSSWPNAAHIMTLSAPSATTNQVTMNFWSVPRQDDPYFYSYQSPSFQSLLFGFLGVPIPQNPQFYYNPMTLQMNLWPINNSQGFETRTLGPTGSVAQNQLFQFQVTTGHLTDGRLNYVLILNGQTVSQGSMILCQSPNCQSGY